MLEFKKLNIITFALCAGLTACPDIQVVKDRAEDTCCAVDDPVPPVISCVEVADGQPLGQEVPLQCTVTDDQGVLVVTSFFRLETSTYWDDEPMREVGEGVYEGAIPREDVQGGGMFYYFEAVDEGGNTASFPSDGEDGELHFRVSAD